MAEEKTLTSSDRKKITGYVGKYGEKGPPPTAGSIQEKGAAGLAAYAKKKRLADQAKALEEDTEEGGPPRHMILPRPKER